MNQYQDTDTFSLTPDLTPAALDSTLARVLIPGSLMDSRLKAYCNRLQERFNLFCSACPVPQWDKGLIITPEIRCQSDIYLPLAEIRTAFRYLLLRSCRYKPFFPAVPIFSSLSWVDALEQMQPFPFSFNPARIIADVAGNQDLRAGFLASLFVPQRYGGGFGRYPLQQLYLQEWLAGCSGQSLSVLDAACGSGEGVYEIAAIAAESGFNPHSTTIYGCTVEPLELVAAAHGWLPHSAKREVAQRQMIASVARQGWRGAIKFFAEDICQASENSVQHDVVICNGLLGGPLLHEHNALKAAVKGLSRRVKTKGIILAADRFHGGWRKITPLADIEQLLEQNGFRIIALPEGIGGIRI